MATGKTHIIKTIGDLFRLVNADNIVALNKDLTATLIAVGTQKAIMEAAGGGEPDYDTMEMRWIDDGIHAGSAHAVSKGGKVLGTIEVKPKQDDDQRAE